MVYWLFAIYLIIVFFQIPIRVLSFTRPGPKTNGCEGNFNVLLLRRRTMPSGNAGRARVSLLLIALMLVPMIISFSAHAIEPEKEHVNPPTELGIAMDEDPSRGWGSSGIGVGEALLYHRKAVYVPLDEWQHQTGDRIVSGWHVVGHDYPIPSDWWQELGEAGLACQTFVSPQGFHCDVPDLAIGTLMELDIIGLFRFDPTDKIAPDVLPLVNGDMNGPIFAEMEGEKFVINVLLSGDGHFEDLMAGPFEVREIFAGRFATLVTDEKGISWLSSQDFVEWLEPSYPTSLDNEAASDIVNVDWVTDPNQHGGAVTGTGTLTGSGIIVGVADSGLDVAAECSGISHCNTVNSLASGIHPDFYGRIAYVESFHGACVDDGPNDYNGHGTHVAGSVLGSGANSEPGSNHAGMAPGAQLYMQATQCIGAPWDNLYPPSDLQNDLFQPAYDFGARVHTNSWGTGPSGSYPNYYSWDTLKLDQAAYSMDDMVILFAMGNDGEDGNSNGEVDLAFMNRQATAKNIISVGASENFRPGLGGVWGTIGSPPLYPVTPISSDGTNDNQEGMAAFSNRGPTNDGRIKPDIVAPGTFIISTLSGDGEATGTKCAVNNWAGGDDYCIAYGTSMATPITAGSTALILEHLNNIGHTDDSTNSNDPASAMVKAIQTAGAHDMVGQYTSFCPSCGSGDGKNGAQETAPNPHEGWGRVDLQGAVERKFLDGIDITTGERHSIKLTLPVGLSEIRVVLSWNDHDSNSPILAKQLVNDLDITLKDPSGSAVSYSNDDLNNLVGITVENPSGGDWEIIVDGVNVPHAQTYYVASSNGSLQDMRKPVQDALGLNVAGFQAGSIFTETSLSSGGDHLCVIYDDSSLNCWGDNEFGQLGDGTEIDRLTLSEVGLDSGRTAVSVSTGHQHTCAVLDDASLKCWGNNNFGQLGDGTTTSSSSPVSVSLSGVPVQVSAGKWHSCAVLDDASLECWGRNNDGQLGDGTNTDQSTPVSVSFGGGKVLAVSAGGHHTCAVLDDWGVSCWGSNSNGQLGIGSTPTTSNTPNSVTTGGNTVAVSAGGSHTCALLEDSSLKCWGANGKGQLGYGNTNELHDASSVGVVLSSVISVDLGDEHTCAIDSSNALHCWGGGTKGQIGDGSTSDSVTSPSAIDLGNVLGATSVAIGGSHSCVIASNDLLRCWGGHGSGPLSIGTSPDEFEVPRWTYIISGERDLDGDSTLNIFEVGVSDDADHDGFPSIDDSFPNNPTKAANCSPGNYGRFTCKPATAGFFVSGWGNTLMTPARAGYYVDSSGATSDTPCDEGFFQALTGKTECDPALPGYYVGSTGQSSGTPCPGGKFNPDYGQTDESACTGSQAGYSVPVLTQVTTGGYHTCTILDDGSISCWGDNSNGQLGDGTRTPQSTPSKVTLPLGRKAIDVSAGSYHTCAVLDDGSAKCWGDNGAGQLGDGTTVQRLIGASVNLGAGRTAVSISAGGSHTCAILDDESVKCWGDNSNGQLGDGTITDRVVPVSADLGDSVGALSITAGAYHTCAIMDDRKVKCWGDNWHGQIGDGGLDDSLSPTEIDIPSNSSAVTIDGGSFHTCVGMNDGSMFCWGNNGYGQFGNGNSQSTTSPTGVALIETQSPTQVSMGSYHSCALFDDGNVSCWGGNSEGQVGDGTQSDRVVPTPVSIPLGKKALSISVGQRHSCAILDDATLKCWGLNSDGQLGDGSSTSTSSPTDAILGHGSSAEIACTPGTYQPEASQTSCILADRGYSAPLPGSLNQTGCNKGYYSGLRGQATCTPADFGFYVDQILAVSQTQCPEYQSTLQQASNNFDLCRPDFDGDLVPDDIDTDDDNDGVEDRYDFDPLDPNVSVDSDGDNIPDSIDTDDDNDGFEDSEDLFPYNQAEWKDDDGDGIGDNNDPDDDGDGRNDIFDVFPTDPFEWSDFDGDGTGDNMDPDDDNDDVCDSEEGVDQAPGVPAFHLFYSNGTIEKRGCNPGPDIFPLDSTEWLDSDGDSIGNNADWDDDGDGYNDTEDAFELDPTEWADSDGDYFGDNSDWAPEDPTEWIDSDGDQVGNNADECPYEQGLNSSYENWAHLNATHPWGCPVSEVIEEEEPVELQQILMEEEGLDTDGDGDTDYFDDDDDDDGICDGAYEVLEERDPISNEVTRKGCSMGPDGKLDASGLGKFSKDANRPFSNVTWAMISVSALFVGLMGYRLFGWKKRQVSKLKTKRVRLR